MFFSVRWLFECQLVAGLPHSVICAIGRLVARNRRVPVDNLSEITGCQPKSTDKRVDLECLLGLSHTHEP